jgi:hypothetical protein
MKRRSLDAVAVFIFVLVTTALMLVSAMKGVER